jgi:hypothetical protein
MELKGASYLYELATLMVTFAGFSALLLAIRQSAGGRLSSIDRFLAKTTVGHAIMLTGGALLPPLLSLFEIPEASIWKASALIFGLPMLALLLTFPKRRMAATGKPPPKPVLAIFVGLGSASLIAMVVFVFAKTEHRAAAYIAALTVNFFTLAFAFVIALDVILQQPTDTVLPTLTPADEVIE